MGHSGPRQVLVLGPSGTLGPWRPMTVFMEVECRILRGVWGEKPTDRHCGVYGGAAAPHPVTLELESI